MIKLKVRHTKVVINNEITIRLKVLLFRNFAILNYIFKIANISRQVLEMLASDFSLSVDKLGTTLTAQITKEQVPLLISALTSHDISIFEVTACNVKRIVQEQLHLEEVRK